MRSIDWASFCHDYNVSTDGTRKNVWLNVQCPFCGDKKHKGAVNLRSGAYHCWKCGKHDMKEFVAAVTGCSNDFPDVMHVLDPYTDGGGRTYVPPKEEEDPHAEAIEIKIKRSPKGLKVPGSKELSKDSKRYLRRRGFNALYLQEKYGLHDGGISGEWAYRIIIPVIVDGKVVSWQGRHTGNSKLRYKAASLEESANIKHAIYNLDNCKRDKVIVVEGIMDVWRLGDDTCALFGISVKDRQLITLAERFKEIYFLFDPEPEAQARANECARKIEMLATGAKAIVLNMSDTDSGDPGELTAEEIVQVKELVFGSDKTYDYTTPWLRPRKE